jgi:hypothetical protein
MASATDTVLFLLGVYWPFMAVAGVVGLVTGWWSLSPSSDEGGQ